MKKILLIITVATMLVNIGCKKNDSTSKTFPNNTVDSLAIVADTAYIRNEFIDTTFKSIVNSKRVYKYTCDMYFPNSWVVQGSAANAAYIEAKANTTSNIYDISYSIFYSKTMDYTTKRIYVQCWVDTFAFDYHWHFYQGNTYINTLDRHFIK